LDHRKSRALFVPVEIQKTNTYPKAVGFASLLVPSIFDAKFRRSRNAECLSNAQLSQLKSDEFTSVL
jgi:hypothetical protein